MVEICNNTARFWSPRHSVETRLRLAYGQTHSEIGRALGMSYHTVRIHVRREGLKPARTLEERLSLALALEADKTIADALGAEPGSASQARLRTGLRLLSRELIPPGGDGAAVRRNTEERESDMRSLKEIREMSVDELRAYVASLVPGLDSKSAEPDDRGADGLPGEIPVRRDGEAGPETPKTGDGLA